MGLKGLGPLKSRVLQTRCFPPVHMHFLGLEEQMGVSEIRGTVLGSFL